MCIEHSIETAGKHLQTLFMFFLNDYSKSLKIKGQDYCYRSLEFGEAASLSKKGSTSDTWHFT
jgi:hypothetical protein